LFGTTEIEEINLMSYLEVLISELLFFDLSLLLQKISKIRDLLLRFYESDLSKTIYLLKEELRFKEV
jgi:hypothetical protein